MEGAEHNPELQDDQCSSWEFSDEPSQRLEDFSGETKNLQSKASNFVSVEIDTLISSPTGQEVRVVDGLSDHHLAGELIPIAFHIVMCGLGSSLDYCIVSDIDQTHRQEKKYLLRKLRLISRKMVRINLLSEKPPTSPCEDLKVGVFSEEELIIIAQDEETNILAPNYTVIEPISQSHVAGYHCVSS